MEPTAHSGQRTAHGGQPTAHGGQPTAHGGQPTACYYYIALIIYCHSVAIVISYQSVALDFHSNSLALGISYHSVALGKEPFSSCSPFDTPRSSGIADEGEFEATHLLAVSLVNAEIIHGIGP